MIPFLLSLGPQSEAIQFASKELKRDPEVLLKADLLVMGILGV